MWAGWCHAACITLAFAVRSKPLPVVSKEWWSYRYGYSAELVMQLLALKSAWTPWVQVWFTVTPCGHVLSCRVGFIAQQQYLSQAPCRASGVSAGAAAAARAVLEAVLAGVKVPGGCSEHPLNPALMGSACAGGTACVNQVKSTSCIALHCISCRPALRELM